MKAIDWDAEAAAMAQHVSSTMVSTHRGAFGWPLDREISVVFGNDGDTEAQRAKDEIAKVRSALDQHGIKVLGFGVARGAGYSWAMLVKSGDFGMLHAMVHSVWLVSQPRRFPRIYNEN